MILVVDPFRVLRCVPILTVIRAATVLPGVAMAVLASDGSRYLLRTMGVIRVLVCRGLSMFLIVRVVLVVGTVFMNRCSAATTSLPETARLG